MDIQNFIQDNKLVIPEEEIDNIYVWTRLTRTQEALLSSEAYYKLMEYSFKNDTQRVISVLKERLTSASEEHYQLSDFMTFNANKKILFNNKNCFVYANDIRLIVSLACYLAHTRNLYLPEEDTLASLILNKIESPDRFKQLMETDFLLLTATAPLPEHKHKVPILDMLFTRRCRDNYCTLVFTFNSEHLFGDNAATKDLAEMKGVKNISKLRQLIADRRKVDYKQLMALWYSMMTDFHNVVYSKTKPKVTQRIVGNNR